MGNLRTALQLYTVRDQMEADFEGTLEKVKQMGYEGVEFAGLFGHSVSDVKKMLERLGLVPVSAHVPFAEMVSDPERVFETYAELGCRFVAVPYMDEEYRPGTEGFDKAIELIRKLGEAAKAKGITLLYHNHDFEFVKVNGEYGLDVIYASIPADLLQTEIDTCWVNVAGVDPADYVRKYTGRSPVVHLKDFVMRDRNKQGQLYELIGKQSNEAGQKEKAPEENFGFRPVGYGMQDIPSIIEASKEAGAEWLVVEQDRPAPGQTSLESAELSIKYLKTLEY